MPKQLRRLEGQAPRPLQHRQQQQHRQPYPPPLLPMRRLLFWPRQRWPDLSSAVASAAVASAAGLGLPRL